MEKGIINSILDRILKRKDIGSDGEFIQFSDKKYKPFTFSKENFHKIKHTVSDSSLLFIDGGNLEIAGSADFSLQFIRVYYTKYQNNLRVSANIKEGYALITANAISDEIKYGVEMFPKDIFPMEDKNLEFSSFDSTIREGNHRIKVSKIGEVVRKYAELIVASNAISELKLGDILVRDGSLQASLTKENEFFDVLYNKAVKKEVIVTGLSKTSTLLTNKGRSFRAACSIAPVGSWYYSPVVEVSNESHKAEIYFTRLHPESDYIFRFEVYKDNNANIDNIISLLAKNSKDPTFLGYPYGLIEADKFARVSDIDRNIARTKLMAISRKNWNDIMQSEKSLNAHDLLF